MPNHIISTSYNNIYFSYDVEVRRDMMELFEFDIEKLSRPMMRFYSKLYNDSVPRTMTITIQKDNDDYSFKFAVKEGKPWVAA